MEYKVTNDNESGFFIVSTEGKMNAREFIQMAKAILSHPQWVPNGNVLFDHRRLDFDDVPLDDLDVIRCFHQQKEERIGKGRSAIVVKDGFVGKWFDLWSQGEKIKTESNVKVFDSYDQAVLWVRE
ncbi:hypothetical protein ACFLQ8_00640 [Candidatus Auribacterota bacterium]